MEVLFFVLIIIFLGLITVMVAEKRSAKGSPLLWFMGGMLLFVVALPVALLVKVDPKKIQRRKIRAGYWKKCPRCAEMVKEDAFVCKNCGQDFAKAANV